MSGEMHVGGPATPPLKGGLPATPEDVFKAFFLEKLERPKPHYDVEKTLSETPDKTQQRLVGNVPGVQGSDSSQRARLQGKLTRSALAKAVLRARSALSSDIKGGQSGTGELEGHTVTPGDGPGDVSGRAVEDAIGTTFSVHTSEDQEIDEVIEAIDEGASEQKIIELLQRTKPFGTVKYMATFEGDGASRDQAFLEFINTAQEVALNREQDDPFVDRDVIPNLGSEKQGVSWMIESAEENHLYSETDMKAPRDQKFRVALRSALIWFRGKNYGEGMTTFGSRAEQPEGRSYESFDPSKPRRKGGWRGLVDKVVRGAKKAYDMIVGPNQE